MNLLYRNRLLLVLHLDYRARAFEFEFHVRGHQSSRPGSPLLLVRGPRVQRCITDKPLAVTLVYGLIISDG